MPITAACASAARARSVFAATELDTRLDAASPGGEPGGADTVGVAMSAETPLLVTLSFCGGADSGCTSGAAVDPAVC